MKNEFNRLIKDLVEPFTASNGEWITTDGITKEIVESGDFRKLINNAEVLTKVLEQAVAQQVRQSIRSKKDANGLPLFANLSYLDEDGNAIHLYKPNSELDENDTVKLRGYWVSKTIDARNKAVYYDRMHTELTGKQIPLPFDADSFSDD